MEDQQELLKTTKQVIHSLLISSPRQVTVEKLQRDYHSSEGRAIPYGRFGFKNVESFLLSLKDTLSVNGHGPVAIVQAVRKSQTDHIQNLVQTQKKKPINGKNVNFWRKPRFCFESEKSDLVFINEGRTNGQSQKRWQSQNKFKNEVPKRNACSDMHAVENRRGQTSITTECKQILLEVIKPTHIEGSACNHNKQMFQSIIEPKFLSDSDNESLDKYAINERVLHLEYPKNAVRSNRKVQYREVHKELQLNELLQIHMVKIRSPHSFNFWEYRDKFHIFYKMWTNMQQFYSNLDSDEFTIPESLLMVGHLCVVKTNLSTWERAVVSNIIFTNKDIVIQVELFDTGDVFSVENMPSIKFLFEEYAELPAQFMRGSMACVAPWYSNWSMNALKFFWESCVDRSLCAKVQEINQKNNIVSLVIVDPKPGDPTNLNVALIERNCARQC